jgi:hemoglobin
MQKLFVALLLAASGLVHAADDSLYRAFGEKAGIATLMTDFVGRLKADARIGRFFKDVNPKHLATQLTDQLCMVSGGPCAYEGETMARSHAELGIQRADFNALVEVLQDTMSARGIAFADQNRMLARLAPMHREIITPANAANAASAAR